LLKEIQYLLDPPTLKWIVRKAFTNFGGGYGAWVKLGRPEGPQKGTNSTWEWVGRCGMEGLRRSYYGKGERKL
jgi:hypothetical protein